MSQWNLFVQLMYAIKSNLRGWEKGGWDGALSGAFECWCAGRLSWDVFVSKLAQLCVQWHQIGSLELTMVGGFKTQESVNATNQGFAPSQRHSTAISKTEMGGTPLLPEEKSPVHLHLCLGSISEIERTLKKLCLPVCPVCGERCTRDLLLLGHPLLAVF
jgi:hypothetical protein